MLVESSAGKFVEVRARICIGRLDEGAGDTSTFGTSFRIEVSNDIIGSTDTGRRAASLVLFVCLEVEAEHGCEGGKGNEQKQDENHHGVLGIFADFACALLCSIGGASGDSFGAVLDRVG